MSDALLLIDYVYLDAEERKKFAQAAHEYLIDVIQFTGEEAADTQNLKYRLTFNHPSKELIWCLKLNRYFSGESWIHWATNGDWVAARDIFAKKVWLATRTLLSWSGTEWKIDLTAYTAGATGPVDEVSKPVISANIVGNLLTLANKIDAQLIFATSSATAPASLANVALIKNEVTMEDMSRTLAYWTTGISNQVAPVNQVLDFLNDNAIVIKNWNNCGLYADGSENPVLTVRLQLNALDRFQKRDGFYFNYVQPYQHHTNTPGDGLNVYSFALKPEDHQPSGTANFSRIDNTTLSLEVGQRGSKNSTFASDWLGTGSVVRIYCTSYNVLRIMSGMGGLAYSN